MPSPYLEAFNRDASSKRWRGPAGHSAKIGASEHSEHHGLFDNQQWIRGSGFWGGVGEWSGGLTTWSARLWGTESVPLGSQRIPSPVIAFDGKTNHDNDGYSLRLRPLRTGP